jgi:hypothetical protein
MHIAYSALHDSDEKSREHKDQHTTRLRYRAYKQACEKHQEYIAQIQKYLPGWFPKFDYNTKYKQYDKDRTKTKRQTMVDDHIRRL